MLAVKKPYPDWVCRQCGIQARHRISSVRVSTYHNGLCGVCGEMRAVTEPRDFGYPKFDNCEDEDQNVSAMDVFFTAAEVAAIVDATPAEFCSRDDSTGDFCNDNGN